MTSLRAAGWRPHARRGSSVTRRSCSLSLLKTSDPSLQSCKGSYPPRCLQFRSLGNLDVVFCHQLRPRQIPSRVCFQRQSIGVVLLFASWSEVLSHDIVFRRPAIVTLALQPSLPNGIVRYLLDLKVSHILHLQWASGRHMQFSRGCERGSFAYG